MQLILNHLPSISFNVSFLRIRTIMIFPRTIWTWPLNINRVEYCDANFSHCFSMIIGCDCSFYSTVYLTYLASWSNTNKMKEMSRDLVFFLLFHVQSQKNDIKLHGYLFCKNLLSFCIYIQSTWLKHVKFISTGPFE